MSVVTKYLEQRGISFEVIPHQRAFTSVDEARTMGVEADEVLKTVVVDTSSRHALAVVPGSRRLDMHRVREAVGDQHAHLATEDELARDFPRFELGAFPPLGSLLGVETFVDPEVSQHETVVFAAGTQTESVRLKTADLFRDEKVHYAPLVREPGEDSTT